MSFTNLVLVERDIMSAAGDGKEKKIDEWKDWKDWKGRILNWRTSPAFKLIYRKLLLKLNSFKPCQFYVYLNHDYHLFQNKHTTIEIYWRLILYLLFDDGEMKRWEKGEEHSQNNWLYKVFFFFFSFIFNALCSSFAIVRVR